jgi:flagellar basal-body rod protein FlgF
MNGALFSAVSGGLAAAERLEIVANNLANINTAGFKAQYLLVSSSDPGEDAVPGGLGQLDGVPGSTAIATAFEMSTDFSQGAIHESGNPLDVALMGPGFFAVTTPDGERYTRQGQFQLAPDGVLVTPAGHSVQDQDGEELRLPPGRIEIDTGGGITVDGARRGSLRVVTFTDTGVLVPQGGSLFTVANPEAAPVDADLAETRVLQGSTEAANVDAIRGLLELIDVARGYEAYMQAVQQVDGTVETAIQQVAGV